MWCIILFLIFIECDPACENDGECVGPDKCACPVGFSGPVCQNDDGTGGEFANLYLKSFIPEGPKSTFHSSEKIIIF